MASSALRSVVGRIGRLIARAIKAVRLFGHYVRHSAQDTEAVYGPNPNNVTPEERVAKAAVIASGLGGGGGGQASG